MIGALGDVHGAFDAARAIIARHPGIGHWICVGDIADDRGRYESLGADVYWIHGNNDNFDAIAGGDLPADLHHIANGTAVEVAGLRIAALGGTFAPTWYDTAAADLPHPNEGGAKVIHRQASGAAPRAPRQARGAAPRAPKDDKRRHFVRDEVEACKALRDIDIFLTHEAAKPFRPFPGGRGPDAGKAQINEILAAMRPRLHLFGHHHRFSEQVREDVPSIGLDLVSRGYLLIDTPSLRIDTVKS